MKKLSIIATVAIIAMASASCSHSPKASLHNDIDSLSYAIGLANGTNMKAYLQQQGIDTAYIADFVRGFKEGTKAGNSNKDAAFYMGLQIGSQMTNGISKQIFSGDSVYHVSNKNLIAGLIDGIKGNKKVMDVEKMGPQIDAMADRVHNRVTETKYGENKAAGAKFLAENAKKPGVKTLPSGVQYKVIKEGTGAIPTDTSKVKLNYEGKTIDGTVFDSSAKHGQPIEMIVRQNIPGFAEALTHMPAGSTWEIYIPAEQAYGDRGAGDMIKPFSTLIFKVDLLEVN